MSINRLLATFLVVYIVSAFAVPIEDSHKKQVNKLLSILSGLDKAVDPCEDAYSYACKKDGQNWTPEYLKKIYPEVRNALIKILNQKPTENEVRSLSIEKQLFQQCMNLGAKETSEANSEKDHVLTRIFDGTFRQNANWQIIDGDLSTVGMGHSFFDISVERNPENPSQNIITLKPPSHAHIKHIKHLITKAFEPSTKNNTINRIVNDTPVENRHLILNFLRILHPLSLFTTTGTGHAEKIKLNNLNSVAVDNKSAIYLQNRIESDPLADHFPELKDFLKSQENYDESNNKIDWIHVIQQHFSRVTNIDDNEIILIKHKPYFVWLNKLLNSFSNDAIVDVMKFKVIIENLRYIEWKSANSLEHIKRSTFCFGDTKLYGASFRLIRDLRKDTHKEGQYYEVIQNMLHEIVDVINTEINNSKTISSTEKAYYVSEMKLITVNALHQNRNYVSEYYKFSNGAEFQFASSYFVNIRRYKQLLHFIELDKLRADSKSARPEPFSITDLDRPSNRFVFSLFVHSHYSPLAPELPKEIHYSVYGVKIASFLFGLFNEQKSVDALQERKRDDWSVHPAYSKAALDCFTSNLDSPGKKLSEEMLTELFGLRIAYKAMLKDYLDEGSRKYFVPDLAPEGVTADQMFFASYARYHCHYGKTVINTIMSNVDAFDYAYMCYDKNANELPKCHLKGFEIQEGNLLSRA